MIDQLKQRLDREKRLQADVNALVQFAAAFEDERDDLRALAVQLAEALSQYVPKPGDLFTAENIGTFDIIERAVSALAAARKAG